MASGISISIASETREYAAGIQRGVIQPTEEVQQALDHLDRSDAGAKLEEGMRGAQRGTEALKEDIGQLSRQVQATGTQGKASGDHFKAGMHEADEGVKTLKENTASNLKEVAASFDGTTSGAVSGVQGLAAEFLEGFGPGGLIAGAVVAGGIGLLLTGIEDADTQTEAFKADVSALTQAWIESGREGKLSIGQVVDGLKALATNTDASKASLADVEQQAKALGVPFKELAHVYAEGGDATQYALERTQQLIEAEKRRMTGAAAGSRAGLGAAGRENAAAAEHIKQLEAQRGKLVGVQKETTEAAKREREWLAAGGPDLQAKADATESYATSVQESIQQAGASWDDYKDKEGGLSLDKYIKVTQAKVRATEQYEANMGRVAAAGNQAALNYVESLGTDAAPLLEKFVHAPASKQHELVKIWAQLGKASTSSYKSAIEDGMPGAVRGPKLLAPDSSHYLEGVRSAHWAAQQYINRNPLLQAFSVANNNSRLIP